MKEGDSRGDAKIGGSDEGILYNSRLILPLICSLFVFFFEPTSIYVLVSLI